MNIVFLCGSLEPGRDGVGDYTRRLAGELLRQNHQVFIIALQDKFLSGSAELIGTQEDEEKTISILRLSDQLSWSARISNAREFIESVNPDIISLQYVPFSFQDKGLPYNFKTILKQLRRGRPLHIMFHELWVGISVQSSMQYVWWGKAQRYLIKLLLETHQPQVVHTHTPLYQIQLSKLGVKSSLLPLFTNIPLANNLHDSLEGSKFDKEQKLGFVLFGGIFTDAPVRQLASEVAVYTNKTNIAVDLTLIGRSGSEQENWANAWRSYGLTVHILGEQSSTRISEILSQSSIGLSTTPAVLAGKSGSVAAMHTHGLPVLCVTQPWQPRGIKGLTTLPGTFQYSIGNFDVFINNHSKNYFHSKNISDITRQFTNSLSTNFFINKEIFF